MEKKTIGSFIATLRKANGMTQKDLANQLNVSDKTVSRWERDDGAPDLSLIPIIAEIFGVTCDELLRGECNSPEDRAEEQENHKPHPKSEKQRQYLLKSTLLQYKNRTYVAAGISVVGIIVALVCNLAFLKAILGFFLGAIFFATSILCQIIFVNHAFFCVEDADLHPDVLSDYKRSVIHLAQRSVGLTIAFLGFTAPLLLADAYVGITFDSLLLWGFIGAAVFLLAYLIVLYFFNAALLKCGIYSLSEKESRIYHHNHSLKRTCTLLLVALVAVTFVGHQAATSIWGPFSIMDGTTFTDYDSFIAYMEQDIPSKQTFYNRANSVPNPSSEILTYYDQYGNEISQDEALTRRLEDSNGNVVCEYIARNQNVASIQYSPKDGTILPIKVFTYDALQIAKEKAALRHIVFGILYCIEFLAVVLLYYKKRAK